MSSTLNLEAMREEHLHFVTRLSKAYHFSTLKPKKPAPLFEPI